MHIGPVGRIAGGKERRGGARRRALRHPERRLGAVPDDDERYRGTKMLRNLGIAFGLLIAGGPFCAAAAAAEPSRDEHLRRQVIGSWQDDYQGRRTKTLDEDGTGTMVVELDGMRARLFARRLTFEMVWSIENGRLKKRTVRGQPVVQVQMILRSMGDRVEERILELTDDRLLLLDQDGKTRYDWRRKPEEPADGGSTAGEN